MCFIATALAEIGSSTEATDQDRNDSQVGPVVAGPNSWEALTRCQFDLNQLSKWFRSTPQPNVQYGGPELREVG